MKSAGSNNKRGEGNRLSAGAGLTTGLSSKHHGITTPGNKTNHTTTSTVSSGYRSKKPESPLVCSPSTSTSSFLSKQ